MEINEERRQELLDTYLLHYNMPSVEELSGLTITELEFLMKSAEIYHKRKVMAGDNFIQKIDVFREAVVEAVRKLDKLYVALNPKTGYPNVMGDGTVMVFSEEEYALKAQKHYEEENLKLDMKIADQEKQQALWADLYWWGMEKIALDVGSFTCHLDRGVLLPPPDYSNLPKIQVPVINPKLVLAMVRHRQTLLTEQKDEQWNKAEQYLGRQMFKELVKGQYLCPAQFSNPNGTTPDADGKMTVGAGAKMKFAVLTDKDGRKWFPAFTDWQAFQRLYDKKEWDGQVVSYEDLTALSGENGIVINPGGMETRLDGRRKEFLKVYVKRLKRIREELESGRMKEKKPGFYIGELSEQPEELVKALTECMKQHKEIKKAYLMLKLDHGDEISYLLAVDCKGDRDAIFASLVEAVRESADYLPIDMHELNENVMTLIGDIKPFYKKSFLGL